MRYEKQFRIRDELNARFPRMRKNLGQQMFRMAYYNLRLAGQDAAEAFTTALDVVRLYVPNFVPVEA